MQGHSNACRNAFQCTLGEASRILPINLDSMKPTQVSEQ